MARKKPEPWPTCGPCAYFCQAEGECRRYPPVLTGVDDLYQPIQHFPTRDATSPACGEFRQRLSS